MAKEAYRNVVVDGRRVTGERKGALGDWIRFQGGVDLMKIDHAWSNADPRTAAAIWAQSDGYGEPGHVPVQGYDWSGIRDSSRAATARMLAIAERWNAGKPWPWEAPKARARVRVTFKHEDEVGGEPVGPVAVVAAGDAGAARPYEPKCTCDKPDGEPGDTCGACFNDIPAPWVTRREALAVAAKHGVALEEA